MTRLARVGRKIIESPIAWTWPRGQSRVEVVVTTNANGGKKSERGRAPRPCEDVWGWPERPWHPLAVAGKRHAPNGRRRGGLLVPPIPSNRETPERFQRHSVDDCQNDYFTAKGTIPSGVSSPSPRRSLTRGSSGAAAFGGSRGIAARALEVHPADLAAHPRSLAPDGAKSTCRSHRRPMHRN
jgi:hypothetical protein